MIVGLPVHEHSVGESPFPFTVVNDRHPGQFLKSISLPDRSQLILFYLRYSEHY